MWEPYPLTTLGVSTACNRDIFTFFFTVIGIMCYSAYFISETAEWTLIKLCMGVYAECFWVDAIVDCSGPYFTKSLIWTSQIFLKISRLTKQNCHWPNLWEIFIKFLHFLFYNSILLMITKTKSFFCIITPLFNTFFPASYWHLNAIRKSLVAHVATDIPRYLHPCHIKISLLL
jgi:hypothetical protein